jgi:hypothetical protein
MTTEVDTFEDETPHVNDLTPLSEGDEIEPMLAIDVSSSMNDPAAPGSQVTKREVAEEILGAIVAATEGLDSQAEAERQTADEAEIGGVYSCAFASSAQDLEDINTKNLSHKRAEIRWGGGTHIMGAWNLLSGHYVDEFGSRPKIRRPRLAAMFVTDGEAADAAQFAAELEQADDFIYAVVAIIGHGGDHDATLEQYQEIARVNPRVRVLSFDSETSGTVIGNSLVQLLG